MSRGLRGFESLRARPSIPIVERTPERRCRICNAVLSRHNAALLDLDDGIYTLDRLARMLRRGPKERCRERNALICERYAAGESQYALAKAYGLTRSAVQQIVKRGRGCAR